MLDHTSILKLIGLVFDKNGNYSQLVDYRPVGSVLDLLEEPHGVANPPVIPALDDYRGKESQNAGFLGNGATVTNSALFSVCARPYPGAACQTAGEACAGSR